jgi:hypothetical protein
MTHCDLTIIHESLSLSWDHKLTERILNCSVFLRFILILVTYEENGVVTELILSNDN